MTVHSTFLTSAAARPSLKRGLAGQAFTHARAEADLPHIMRALQDLAPNAKAHARVARRIAACRGVAQVRA